MDKALLTSAKVKIGVNGRSGKEEVEGWGGTPFHLEVSVRPEVWARRRTGAGVGRRACRDMVWRRDPSSAAEESRRSPLDHTGTGAVGRGGLQGEGHKERQYQLRAPINSVRLIWNTRPVE